MEKLKCDIVKVDPARRTGFETDNIHYVVTDKNNVVVATGISSTPNWVRHDAGGYHTKKKFDEMFPDGWEVEFNF